MNRGSRRGHGKRGQVPMRVRRRQSDAKWRASVASCYETLKLIIPNGKNLPKRKASKALILEETEKHIEELERGIAQLLNAEAFDQQRGVLWGQGNHWTPATVEHFRSDFGRKQSTIFQQSTQGKRCYNMLHDIQEEILGLSVTPETLAFVPVTSSGGSTTTKDAATCTNRRSKASKARCRHETERACQRVLSQFKPGQVVEAVIPTARKQHFQITRGGMDSLQLQAVPTMNFNSQAAEESIIIEEGDRTIMLQRDENGFSAVPDSLQSLPVESQVDLSKTVQVQTKVEVRPVHQVVHNFQEVPVMTSPSRVYGIAGNDVMMTQEYNGHDNIISQSCDLLDPFTSSIAGYTTPARSQHLTKSIKREHTCVVPQSPTLSTVCKQLDFSSSPSESLFTKYENDGQNHMASGIVTTVSTTLSDFTPVKAVVSPSTTAGFGTGLTPVQTDTVPSVGFTPVKLPSDPYASDQQLFSPNSAWALWTPMDARVPQAGLSDLDDLDMEENRSLLCMENFDLDDTTDGHEAQSWWRAPQLVNPLSAESSCGPCYEHGPQDLPAFKRTPQKQDTPVMIRACRKNVVCKRKCRSASAEKTHRHEVDRSRPKCRKRLEGLFEKRPQADERNVNNVAPVAAELLDGDCSDFDGYLFYYRQVVPDLKKQLGGAPDANTLAAIVSDMWQQLPSDNRNTLVTLAALENQDSNSSENGSLSQDLEGLDVKPLCEEFQENIVT